MFNPSGFVAKLPCWFMLVSPLEINRSASDCLVCFPPGGFLSAAVLFLLRCVSRLKRIGTVWLAVWGHGGRSHSDLSLRLLGEMCMGAQGVKIQMCVMGWHLQISKSCFHMFMHVVEHPKVFVSCVKTKWIFHCTWGIWFVYYYYFLIKETGIPFQHILWCTVN